MNTVERYKGYLADTLGDLFEDAEEVLATATTLEELKLGRLEYFKQHRYVVAYFLYLQEEIERKL